MSRAFQVALSAILCFGFGAFRLERRGGGSRTPVIAGSLAIMGFVGMVHEISCEFVIDRALRLGSSDGLVLL